MAEARFATPLEGAGARASTRGPGISLGDLVSLEGGDFERCAQVEARGVRRYMRLRPGVQRSSTVDAREALGLNMKGVTSRGKPGEREESCE